MYNNANVRATHANAQVPPHMHRDDYVVRILNTVTNARIHVRAPTHARAPNLGSTHHVHVRAPAHAQQAHWTAQYLGATLTSATAHWTAQSPIKCNSAPRYNIQPEILCASAYVRASDRWAGVPPDDTPVYAMLPRHIPLCK